MAKKLLVCAMCLVAVLSLNACKKQQKAASGADSQEASQEIEKVTIALGFSTNAEDPRGVAYNSSRKKWNRTQTEESAFPFIPTVNWEAMPN